MITAKLSPLGFLFVLFLLKENSTDRQALMPTWNHSESYHTWEGKPIPVGGTKADHKTTNIKIIRQYLLAGILIHVYKKNSGNPEAHTWCSPPPLN